MSRSLCFSWGKADNNAALLTSFNVSSTADLAAGRFNVLTASLTAQLRYPFFVNIERGTTIQVARGQGRNTFQYNIHVGVYSVVYSDDFTSCSFHSFVKPAP